MKLRVTSVVARARNFNSLFFDLLITLHFDKQFHKPKQNIWNILEPNGVFIRCYLNRAKRLGFWNGTLIVRKKSRKTFCDC